MWGYETDTAGDLVLYLTDSDDDYDGMFRQTLKMSGDGHLYLDGADSETAKYAYDPDNRTGWELTEIHGLTAPLGEQSMPEPSTAAMGLLGVAMLLCHRRR